MANNALGFLLQWQMEHKRRSNRCKLQHQIMTYANRQTSNGHQHLNNRIFTDSNCIPLLVIEFSSLNSFKYPSKCHFLFLFVITII